MKPRPLRNVHPGKTLMKKYLNPAGITPPQLAKATGMSLRRITAIVEGKRGISADTAKRLARYFDTQPTLWMDLQYFFDLKSDMAASGSR